MAKNKPITRPKFFSTEEIEFLYQHHDEQYQEKNKTHQKILELRRKSLNPKTNYWAESVKPDGFIVKEHHSPLIRGQRMRVRGYTWSSIFVKGDENKQIYFTVGIHAHGDNHPIGIIYKLDYEREQLAPQQKAIFENEVKKRKMKWEIITLTQLKDYTWSKLIHETKKYFEEHVKDYTEIIEKVWGESSKYIYENNPNKLGRLCWNTNGWIKPSGRRGKANSKNTHEKELGYGHEEWLFDFDKVIDEYKYGFLEPVRKGYNNHKNKTYNILLYTFDNLSKKRYWVSRINNLKCLTKDEANNIIKIYKKNGWFREMEEDLFDLNINASSLTKKDIDAIDILNVKFKVKDCEIFEELIPVDNSDLITSNRYNLLSVKDNETEFDDIGVIVSGYDPNSGSDTVDNLKDKHKKRTYDKEIELDAKHNILMQKFFNYLKTEYPSDVIKNECNAYGKSRIDIVRQTKKGDVFYELKTYNHPMTSIRVAIGQLFEYCFFPDVVNANKLYVVSHLPINNRTRDYIKHLNKFLKIKLGYIYFDLHSNSILEES